MPPQLTRTAIVTGANKGTSPNLEPQITANHKTNFHCSYTGIGLAIVRLLALSYRDSALYKALPGVPLLIYLAARSPSRAATALDSLHADEALRTSKSLQRDGGLVRIETAELDVTDEASIEALVEHVAHEGASEHVGVGHGTVDILVNNAGVAFDETGMSRSDASLSPHTYPHSHTF